MISNLAKQQQFTTIYYTSQRTKTCSFHEFLNSGDFSLIKSAEDFPFPVINDSGIDDVAMAEDLAKQIKNYKDERLLIVVFTNALHGPFQTESKYFNFSREKFNRYEKALFILDHSINQIIKSAFSITTCIYKTFFVSLIIIHYFIFIIGNIGL